MNDSVHELRPQAIRPRRQPGAFRRLWLLFAQVVTVALALYFVVATMRPEWLERAPTQVRIGSGNSAVPVLQGPALPATGSYREAAGTLELGIRPEYVRVGREGMPVKVTKVEDIGRHKIVRLALEGREIAALLGEDEEVPAEARVHFDPAGINLYRDSWRIGGRA